MGGVSSNPRRITFENSYTNTPSGTIPVDHEKHSGIKEIISADQDIEEISIELALFKTKPNITAAAAAGDDYWINRFENLQIQHRNINKILQTEYEKAVQSTNKLFVNPNSYISEQKSQMIADLHELQAKISKCYKDNPNQTLVCSNVVRDFETCVKTSQNLLDEGSLKKQK